MNQRLFKYSYIAYFNVPFLHALCAFRIIKRSTIIACRLHYTVMEVT